MGKKNNNKQKNKKELKEYSENTKRESSTNNSEKKSQLAGAEQQQKSQQSVWSTSQPRQSTSGGSQSQQLKTQHSSNASSKAQIYKSQQSGSQIQQKTSQQAAEGVQQKRRPGWQNKSQQSGNVGVGNQHQRGEHNERYQQRGPVRNQGQGGYQKELHSENTLSQQMHKMSTSDEEPLPFNETSCNGIVRGTLGEPGIVEVNYLKLCIENMPNEAYHYDVSIIPDRPKKFLRSAFEQFRLKAFPNVLCAFDGKKNCYTLERLKGPIDCKVEVSDLNNRMKEFHVHINETDNCVVDLSSLRTYQKDKVYDKPMRALQVLEIVLASNNHERGVRARSSFFRRPNDSANLGNGYEAWTGLYQAAILGEEPLLNVDISYKSFPRESSLIEYLSNAYIGLDTDIIENPFKFNMINSFLKGMNIIYTPPTNFGNIPKQYKVNGIVEPASKKTFKNDDGKTLTVAEYFKSKDYPLEYPNLNCLSVGSSVKPIALPMELCSIPGGQVLNRKDQGRQVDNMIKYAAISTNERKRKIMELLQYFDHNVNPIINKFGLRIGSNFIQVPMRILDAPFIEYHQGQIVTPLNGVWRMDSKKFLICSKPPNGHKWIILYDVAGNDDQNRINLLNVEDFKSEVIKMSKSFNMNLRGIAEIKPFTYKNLSGIIKNLAKESYDLVFIVLSDKGTPYSKVKQIAELQVGILTQCIKYTNIININRTIISNMLLKVNGKLNGINHKIVNKSSPDLFEPLENVMYMGADVTHPSSDQRNIPSIVGVVASHDQHGALYNPQYRLQKSKVEIIEDMEVIVIRHLKVYQKNQNCYPSQIIYYRDGVSDGDFPKIKSQEILAIKSACQKLKCEAKVTCIIAVKRHHTRFFPMTQPKGAKDFNNVQPGTVVDQHITHPNEVQFFMVSHQSIKGTARPTRYNVIFDEFKFDINHLQQLTYNLCHSFPRCNRAVSYPAPTYLAHLLAFRGRVYLEGTKYFDELDKEYEKRQIKEVLMIKNPMYFI